MRLSDAAKLNKASLSPRIDGMAPIASIAVGEISLCRTSEAPSQTTSGPRQARNGATCLRRVRTDITASIRFRRNRQTCARYQRRASGSADQAGARYDGVALAGRYL